MPPGGDRRTRRRPVFSDDMAEVLFSAHVVQHLILMLIAPPLLVLGAPMLALLWALPLRTRRVLARWWNQRRLLRPVMGLLFEPVVAWALAIAALTVWHLPALYQSALQHPLVHAMEHLSFLGTGFLFWSVLLRPDRARRLDYGAAVLYSFTAGLPSSLLGALLTFAGRPLYPIQSSGTSLWGMTPLEDQQLAGLIMWMPGGLVYLAAAASCFVLWHRSDEERASALARRGARGLAQGAVATGVALLLMLCSCRNTEPVQVVSGGNAKLGKSAIVAYGCGTCHVIPGIPQAQGLVGPPLTTFARRTYIAGEAPNTADRLVRWIQAPQSIEPGTAMPNLGVTEQEARNIAAYLYTLK